MLNWPEAFRGRHVIWFVDNTAATAAFVKGASSNEDLERIVGLFWVLAFHLDCSVWFEWVDSKANWSDGISRLYEKDLLSKKLGFATARMQLDMAWWGEPWRSVWERVQHRVGAVRTRRW